MSETASKFADWFRSIKDQPPINSGGFLVPPLWYNWVSAIAAGATVRHNGKMHRHRFMKSYVPKKRERILEADRFLSSRLLDMIREGMQ